MFTGLVQNIGQIRSLENNQGDLLVEIETNMNLSIVPIGASICCSGCCLTVAGKSENSFFVVVSQESQNRTIFGSLCVMDRINLEPSLRLGDELGGHFVFGHVDATTKILSVEPIGASHRIDISLPPHLAQYVAEKGSVTINGVSLTVNETTRESFSVNIIPHTWDNTTMSDLKVNDMVNIEVDMLARYVEKMMQVKSWVK